MSSRQLNAHLLPSLFAPEALAGGVAVVIDVLRASTTITHALAHGAEVVVPCVEVDEALAHRQRDPDCLLGGERGGLPIPGFDLGNSPGDYTPERVAGRKLVFTTTNGTRAMAACRQAQRVLVGCFAHREHLVDLLRGIGEPLHLVCAGTDGVISREDVLMAGCITADLMLRGGRWTLNDEALLALGAWESVEILPIRYGLEAEVEMNQADGPPSWLSQALLLSRGGTNLARLGLAADVMTTADTQLTIVPELDLATWEIRPASPPAA